MTQLYTTDEARIGRINGEILKKAQFVEVTGNIGQMKEIPKDKGDTIEFKRYIPFGGVDNRWIAAGGDAAYVAQHIVQEGVTPEADSITSVTVECSLTQYAALYGYSDKTGKMHEDDIPSEQVDQAGKRIALVREMERFGQLKACMNKHYAGGTSLITVDKTVNAAGLRNIQRDMERSHGMMITEALKPGPNFATRAVEPCFVVYCHSDLIYDIERLPGFTRVVEYSQWKPISNRELGAWGPYRFITSPLLVPTLGAGAAVGTTGLESVGAANVDVYPMIVMAEDAFGQVGLAGENAVGSNHLPPSKTDKADPGGQRGYVWADTWFVSKILNDDWMAVYYVGATDLASLDS